ncbi:MAG: FAD-binding oxidoreductase [Candidatus Omnitrophica bacterium]|nr:FAD-binding oxidoreductase [Candidatus Omnitrophota bacterium]
MKTQVLVIGGGFAGLSTALRLAERGMKDVVVIEQEKALGGHASGRNAGMIRQSVADPFLAALAREGRDLLKRRKFFIESGSLLLAKGRSGAELDQIEQAMKEAGVKSKRLPCQRAVSRVPLLEGADFEEALFTPTDGLVDIEALLKYLLSRLKHFQIPVICGSGVTGIGKEGNVFEVRTGKRILFCEKLVNAAGAWAGILGDKAGAFQVSFKAYRRHLFLSRPLRGVKRDWPFVWDLSHQLYFRPVKGSLLLSPCDKALFSLEANQAKIPGEKTDPQIREELNLKLKNFFPDFKKVKLVSVKAGLRTMVRDGRFVVGEDKTLKGFFWVAGLGGHGVTTCLSVGELAARFILGKKVDGALKEAFSPGRFKEEYAPAC